MNRTVKTPGSDHPITIEPARARVVVVVAGHTVADSTRALSLREAAYPAVLYIPRADVDLALLVKTDNATYCPYKGDCSYYTVTAGGARAVNAIWSYEQPYEAVAAIAGHMAFYPDRVDTITVTPG